MKTEKMSVRDFLNLSEDIDVYDNYTEELGIAFCGPMYLTPEGEKEFSKILDFEIEIIRDYHYADVAIINVDSPVEEVAEKNLKLAIKFFHSLAGYCAEEDYEKWFIEGE